MTTAQQTLLTIEEYAKLPDDGRPTELVRGRLIELNMPAYRHGAVCANVVFILRLYLVEHDIGTVACNDSGVVTQRDPDTLRGADVSFYSYDRLPKGSAPSGYPAASPDLVFEVLSPDNRRARVLTKVGEYLDADVRCVCVLDPDRRGLTVYRPDQPEQQLAAHDTLTLPDILPGFAAQVERFFA